MPTESNRGSGTWRRLLSCAGTWHLPDQAVAGFLASATPLFPDNCPSMLRCPGAATGDPRDFCGQSRGGWPMLQIRRMSQPQSLQVEYQLDVPEARRRAQKRAGLWLTLAQLTRLAHGRQRKRRSSQPTPWSAAEKTVRWNIYTNRTGPRHCLFLRSHVRIRIRHRSSPLMTWALVSSSLRLSCVSWRVHAKLRRR